MEVMAREVERATQRGELGYSPEPIYSTSMLKNANIVVCVDLIERNPCWLFDN